MNNTAAPARVNSISDRVPLYTLFAANGISMVGNILTVIAIPWFVLQTTGSAEMTGLAGFFSALPIAVAAFLGGGIVDRLGFKRTSITADLASGITVALIPVLYVTVGLDFAVLLALIFMTNLLDAPGSTARQAIVPDLATRAGVSFERAGSMNQVVERTARLIGAPIAGAMIATLGATTVLWIDAASFFVSAALVAFFVHAAKPVQQKTRRHWRADFLGGLEFIGKDKLLLTLVLTIMVTNFLDTGIVQTIYMEQIFDNAFALGLGLAAKGGGALIGALLFVAIGSRLPRRLTFIALYMFVALRYFIFALYPPLPVIISLQFLVGLAVGPINAILFTVQSERVPTDLRGRVFGAVAAGAALMAPVGALFTGIAVGAMGLTWTLVIMSSIYLVTIASLLFIKPTLEMDRGPTVQL